MSQKTETERTISIRVVLEQDVPDLAELIADRAWRIQGVKFAEVVPNEQTLAMTVHVKVDAWEAAYMVLAPMLKGEHCG